MDAIMFSGGNQLRLTSTFGGTSFLQIILEKYNNDAGFLVAGTSAGAMAMSKTMMTLMNIELDRVKIEAGNMVVYDTHQERT